MSPRKRIPLIQNENLESIRAIKRDSGSGCGLVQSTVLGSAVLKENSDCSGNLRAYSPQYNIGQLIPYPHF
jgi:hypothetical protein